VTPTSNSPAPTNPAVSDVGKESAPPSSPSGLAQNQPPAGSPALKQTSDIQPSALPSQSAGSPALQNPVTQLAANPPAPVPTKVNAPSPIERYTPPKPIRQVLPDISDLPPSVIAATREIDIIVTVDKSGHVTHTQVEKRGRKMAKVIIAAAETAARQWVFDPARLDGRTVPSEHSIVFQFGR
jgi:hypothetical protein